MDLNKLDTIILTEQEIHNLLEWRNNNQDYVRNFKTFIDEGVIYVQVNKKSKYTLATYFKVHHNKNIHFVYYALTPNINCEKQLTLDVKFTEEGWYVVIDCKATNGQMSKRNDIKQLLYDTVSIFCTIMAYATYFEKEFIERSEIIPYKEKRLQKLQRTAKYNPNHKIKFNKFIYQMKPNTKYKNITKKMYEKHIDSWKVRGHWRQLKDKQIWVKPYKKGTGETEPKQYDLNVQDNIKENEDNIRR